MSFRRSVMKLAASVAIAGLLFTQFAVSAFACPMAAKAAQTQSVAAESGATEAMPCHITHDGNTTTPDSGLCKAHCQDGHKNLSGSQTPVALDFVPAFTVNLTSFAMPGDLHATFKQVAAVPTPAPPIHLRNCVFRI